MDNSEQSKDCLDRAVLVSEDGKNTKSVLCQRCGSKVLCPGMAVFAEKEVIWLLCTDQGFVASKCLQIMSIIQFVIAQFYSKGVHWILQDNMSRKLIKKCTHVHTGMHIIQRSRL